MNALESTLFNDVPVVSELNRVAGFDPLKFLKKTVNFAKRRNLPTKARNWTSKRVAESADRFLFSLQTF